VPSSVKGNGISFAGSLQLLGFCTFESCVGIFWPSIMKMRSQYIPEESRSTIMNFFRIPLNLFVCVVLYNVSTICSFLPISIDWSVKISWQGWCSRLKTVTNTRNLQVNAFPITVMFGMCSIFLFMAAILQRRLMVVADLHKLSTSMFLYTPAYLKQHCSFRSTYQFSYPNF
jgi:hypothetical protein